jgi:uncharacterized membrane protein (DUF373 family)
LLPREWSELLPALVDLFEELGVEIAKGDHRAPRVRLKDAQQKVGAMPRRSNTTDALPNERLDAIAAIAETVLYALAGLVLVAGGFILVGKAAYDFLTGAFDEGVLEAARLALDTLLLTFIFIELFSAVRLTLHEQRLVAEPFLLVGIIAAIKELVLLSGTEELRERGFEQFRNGMIEIGVVVGVVLVLSICTLLLRRSRREPSELEE